MGEGLLSAADWAFRIGEAAVALFFAIAFLQSAYDKIADRQGNLDWLTGHFENSPFAGMVPFLLTLLTFFEALAGLAAVAGAAAAVIGNGEWFVVGAYALCALTLLQLFLGQRLAKDYPGAATIATYFGVLAVGFVMVGAHSLLP